MSKYLPYQVGSSWYCSLFLTSTLQSGLKKESKGAWTKVYTLLEKNFFGQSKCCGLVAVKILDQKQSMLREKLLFRTSVFGFRSKTRQYATVAIVEILEQPVSTLSWNVTTYCRFRYSSTFVLHYLYEHAHLLGCVLLVLFVTVVNRYSLYAFRKWVDLHSWVHFGNFGRLIEVNDLFNVAVLVGHIINWPYDRSGEY